MMAPDTAVLPDAASAAQGQSCVHGVAAWLLREGRDLPDSKAVIGEFCRRLVAEDFPLARLSVGTRTLHPQVLAIGFVWRRGDAEPTESQREHGILESPMYLKSPMKALHDGAPEVRRRLEGPEAVFDYPILVELREEGMTDYLALPMRLSEGRWSTVTIATDRAGGFTDRQLASFADLIPVLALVLEVKETQRITATLVETYLGRDAGRRVLSGLVKRGDGVTIAAALWYCDLRGFTRMSNQLSRDTVISLLNDYFECMAGPVHARGGDVLKFIGDGLLAIFPIRDDLDRDRACTTALEAAREALDGLGRLNGRRREAGEPPLEIGLALHTGAVMYGNIGAPQRLDFTVIGPAVNLVSRIEGLCPVLGYPLLASKRFASPCGSEMVSVGRHRLRGIEEEQELFTLPEAMQAR
jgi:adenylate cyclase